MKRMRAVVSRALLAGGLLLTLPVAVAAQGLNDTIARIIGGRPGSNCNELGGPGNTTGNLAANLCRGIPNSTDGSGAGGTPTLDSQLGQSQEQRRQADRLAERRNGQGGAADQPGTGFGLFVNGDYQFLNKDNTKFESGFEQHTANDAEDRGVRADAKRQGEKRGRREGRRAAQGPHGITQILLELIEEGHATFLLLMPRVFRATVVASVLEVAESALRLRAGLRFGPSGGAQFFGGEVQMQAQFFIDVVGHLTTRPPWEAEDFPDTGRVVQAHAGCSTLKSAST